MNKAQGFKAIFMNMWIRGSKSSLFITRTVHELLWGYEDALLERISKSSPEVEKVFGLMYKVYTSVTTNESSAVFFSIFKKRHYFF